MSFLAVAVLGSGALSAGTSLFAGMEQSETAQNVANMIESSGTQGLNFLQQMVEQGAGAISQYTGEGAGALQPFVSGGGNTLQYLQKLLGIGGGGGGGNAGTATSEAVMNSPLFRSALNQGEIGVANNTTTTGLGGNAATAASQWAVNNQAIPIYQSLLSGTQNLLGTQASSAAGLANLYQGAGSSTANLYGNAGTAGSNIITGTTQAAGSALTGGTAAQAASQVGAAGSLGNSVQLAALLSKLGGGSGMQTWSL